MRCWRDHFILSSGLHSGTYLDKSLVFMHPERTERLCSALADKVMKELKERPSIVVSPAVGGIIPGYETARALGIPAIFTEREDGDFRLRRGFTFGARANSFDGGRYRDHRPVIARVYRVDPVLWCGGLLLRPASSTGPGGAAELDVPMISLARLDIPAFKPDELPPELAALPAVKHGSARPERLSDGEHYDPRDT